MAQKSHSNRFPGESPRYRTARNRLLAAETGLRREVERVARMRRKLPLGGQIPQDYVFDEGPAGSVKLSELFRDKLDTLLIYSFMFGPQARQPCPMCTSFLDSLDGAAIHLTQRANLAVVAKSPIGRIRQFAGDRGWRNLRLLSSSNNTYNPRLLRRKPGRRPVAHAQRVCEAQRQDPSFLRNGAPIHAAGQRAERAPHRHDLAAVESPGPDAGRPRHGLVSILGR